VSIDYPERRPPSEGWRADAAAVAALSFDVDAESAVLTAGAHYAQHLSTMTHQAYGPRVGVPRILALLARVDVEATFFVPGVTAERWPDTVRAIVAGGHEVAFHSHLHRPLSDMTAIEQREDLLRGLEALERLDVRPSGYRAPFWQITRETLDLLAGAGIRYDSSLMDDDRPYVVRSGDGWLAELPVHWSLDDWEQYAFLPDPNIGQQIETPSKVLELWCGELDAMRDTGSLCLITCHPFLSGRPSRVRAIERFVEAARAYGDVRFDRCDRLAERVLRDGEAA
jgi:peptidoglycan/xylan/chitin deacetylase (PgdA/CDA1 family)